MTFLVVKLEVAMLLKSSHEFIIALSGSFDIVLHDGNKEKKYSLNRSYHGLYVPNLLWRRLENFSTNSLALLVSSISYNEDDYIRDFEEFKTIIDGSKR